ncbi:unnamed protein product [Amoebophrya sp. A120]|nr:unnamed protein product [Amoebophrya sp. A120]|eukprot:GSA120T00019479001.1
MPSKAEQKARSAAKSPPTATKSRQRNRSPTKNNPAAGGESAADTQPPSTAASTPRTGDENNHHPSNSKAAASSSSAKSVAKSLFVSTCFSTLILLVGTVALVQTEILEVKILGDSALFLGGILPRTLFNKTLANKEAQPSPVVCPDAKRIEAEAVQSTVAKMEMTAKQQVDTAVAEEKKLGEKNCAAKVTDFRQTSAAEKDVLQAEIDGLQNEMQKLRTALPAPLPPGQAALVSIRKVQQLELLSPNGFQNEEELKIRLFTWQWILAKITEAVSLSEDPNVQGQALQFVQQVQQQLGQIGSVEQYTIFLQNAYQVAGALEGLLASTGEFALNKMYLPAPMRGEWCGDESCS